MNLRKYISITITSLILIVSVVLFYQAKSEDRGTLEKEVPPSIATTSSDFDISTPSTERGISADILSADWSVDMKPSVAEIAFDKRAVAEFMNTFWRDPEDRLKAEQVEDFKWIDIDKDGVYELLVTYTYSRSTGGPAVFKVISGEKVWHQTLGGVLQEIDRAIEDLDADGIAELILPIVIGRFSGQGRALWTAVYKWEDGKFVDASGQFKKFYQARIVPKLEAHIRELNQLRQTPQGVLTPQDVQLSREIHEEKLAAAWMVKDKIARVTGEDPNAGITRAQEWAKSPNKYLRENAIHVFEDINDGNSKIDLEILATDPDPFVAGSAKRALERLNKKSP